MSGRMIEFDTRMMRRAIDLGMRGRGRVEPNPMVGCVITTGEHIIGEGYHQHFGGPHAEPTALAACSEPTEGATLYVTLEPCSHTAKKTPPCVPRLIEAGITRVVAGCIDPNPEVNGVGLEQLRAAGITTVFGVLAEEAKQLVAPFIAGVAYDRPYVTLKWAETADGKVAGPGGRRLQISNARSSREIHALRGRCDAIMVGSNTILVDDPMLTPRGVEFSRRPMRVVLDTSLRIPLQSKLVRTAREARTLVFFASDLVDAERGKLRALHEAGVEPCVADRSGSGLKLDMVLAALGGLRVSHVLVEAGPTLAREFFEAETLVDRVWWIRSPQRVKDPTAPAGPGVPGSFRKTGEIDLDGDRLCEFLNPASPVFFSAEQSADFKLAQLPASAISAPEDAR